MNMNYGNTSFRVRCDTRKDELCKGNTMTTNNPKINHKVFYDAFHNILFCTKNNYWIKSILFNVIVRSLVKSFSKVKRKDIQ